MCATGRPVIACGDFNLPELEWSEDGAPVLTTRSVRALEFMDGLHAQELIQTVRSPTRRDATLDLVLSCGGDTETTVVEGAFESDHLATYSRFYVSTRGVFT